MIMRIMTDDPQGVVPHRLGTTVLAKADEASVRWYPWGHRREETERKQKGTLGVALGTRESQQVSERAAWSLQLGRPQGTLSLPGGGHGMGYR